GRHYSLCTTTVARCGASLWTGLHDHECRLPQRGPEESAPRRERGPVTMGGTPIPPGRRRGGPGGGRPHTPGARAGRGPELDDAPPRIRASFLLTVLPGRCRA